MVGRGVVAQVAVMRPGVAVVAGAVGRLLGPVVGPGVVAVEALTDLGTA